MAMANAPGMQESLPAVVPVGRPLSLIPVGLKEAALDSPTFRATSAHFCEQVDAVEKWLDGLVKSASKLSQEVSVVESLANTYLANSVPPSHLSEALIDQDYAAIALRRYNEGAREFWSHAIAGVKKAQIMVCDPVKTFLQTELRPFKESRRQLEQTQRYYDTILSRYYGQARTKDSSGLREDAFQLHEARKSYLKASMDFCIIAPQFRSTLDSTLIRIFCDRWFEMKDFSEMSTDVFVKNGVEITRVRDWSREMQQNEKSLRHELQQARIQIEESAETTARPSRELDDYSTSTNFSQKPSSRAQNQIIGNAYARQGWVFLRTVIGKPARYSWIRRWAFVKNGIFGWLVQGAKSGGVEESEKIGVLLCSIRLSPQEDRRFCFEVITKDSNVLLQAENQADLLEWVAVFEKAKQRAFEASAAIEVHPGNGNRNNDSDFAFAVSPATAPELAAKRGDGQTANSSEETIPGGPVETESISSLSNRYSGDVSSLRKAAGERDGDHSTRLMQKLDMHRRSVASPTSGGAATSSGGIASLISASHTAFSLATGRPQANSVSESRSPAITEFKTSLAPQTLANPPSATNLTRATILLGMERGYDLGVVDATGGVPSGIMANQWGSANYGHISRMARGEVAGSTPRTTQVPRSPTVRQLSDPQNPARSTGQQPVAPSTGLPGPASSMDTQSTPSRSSKHRNITSEDNTLHRNQSSSGFVDFPGYYPQALKAHDAQFRILFPNRPSDERVLLVFRATWSPDGQQELSGRAFLTPDCMYFYSHHYFVLVSSVELRSISEVSAVPGSHHDFLYVHLKGDERAEPGTVSLKVFLEPLRLLQRRLNYLITNANSEEPEGLEIILQTLLRMDSEFTDQAAPGVTNWEDHPIQRHVGPLPPSSFRASLRVDRGLYDGQLDLDRPRFRLPAQPVQYTPPQANVLAVERVLDISAKALFHMIFGDKSAVFQMLYRQRRSQGVKQYPWMKHDGEHFSREFEYDVQTTSALGLSETLNIKDSQIIDVFNDHLCYVVSDRKTPWHLPRPEDFTLLTKIVITHVAKSRCKIACFTKVDWLITPGITKGILERYALEDLHNDAVGIISLVTDQVQKMGHNCGTQRAIQIFGHIGQQNAKAQITAADPRVVIPGTQVIKRKTLKNIFAETAESFATDAASATIGFATESVTSVLNAFSAHRLITAVLFISLTLQILTSYRVSSKWWQERSAANFMARIGVQPHMTMSKAVYIRDLEANFSSSALQSSPFSHYDNDDNKCSAAFTSILAYMDRDAPHSALASSTSPSVRATLQRMHRARQRLATYRHDLFVALRLVNRIERDVVRAEYENWVRQEHGRCKKLGAVLNGGSGGKGSGEEVRELVARVGGAGVEDVRAWYKEYCAACREEERKLEGSFL